MQEKNFENQVKELLYNHSESAPNVMSKVFEKRTPLYIFKNRLILHKYKLLAAAVLVGLLAFLFTMQLEETKSVLPDVVENGITDGSEGLNIENSVSENQVAQIEAEINKPVVADDNPVFIENETDKSAQEQTPELSNSQNTTDISKATIKDELKQFLANHKNKEGSGTGKPGDQDKQNNLGIGEGTEGGQNKSIDNTNAVAEVENKVTDNEAFLNADNANDAKDISDEANDANTTITKTEASKSSSETNSTEGDEDFDLPKTKDGRWSVAVNTIYGFGNRSFDDKGDGATVIARNESESQKFSYGAEMLLNYRLLPNIDAYTGISYYNRREAMSYQYATEVTDMNVSSRKVIEHHPVFGTREVTVYDTSYTARNVQSNGEFNNSYKHIFVPLGLRYTLYDKKFAYSFAINAGLEVVTKTSGAVLDDQYQEVSLNNDFSRTTKGSMFGFGLGVSYLATDRISILSELRGNYFRSPTNNSSYSLNQFDRGYGLMIGLKYDLK